MRDRNTTTPVPAGGRPTKLTSELVQAARLEAAHGLPVALIADRLGIGRTTAHTWIRNADNKGEDSLEYQFRAAIFLADAEECQNLLGGLRKSAAGTDDTPGNAWAASWLLTHHPRLRDFFSDAAADRRVERKTVATVMDALASAGLTPDDERRVLLQIQARGLGTPPADEGEG
jgi:transposase